MKNSPLVVTLLACTCLSNPAQSATLARCGFDEGFAPGTINAQPSIPGAARDIGFSGPFTYTQSTDETAANYLKVAATTVSPFDLSYTVSGTGGTIPSRIGSLDLSSSAASNPTTATRPLATAITGRDIYVALVIKPITATGLPDLMLNLGQGIYAPFVGIYNGKPSAGLYGCYSPAGSFATSSTALATNASSLLVAKFVWNGTSSKYDTVKLWINPTSTASETPLSSATDTAHAFASFNALSLFALNMPANSRYIVDSIALGTTWNDVMPVRSSSGNAIDPSGGSTVTYANPLFTGTADGTYFTTYCAESFAAVSPGSMTTAVAANANAAVLNFEKSTGFALAPNQLDSNAFVSGTFNLNNALTTIATPGGHSVEIQWRSFDNTYNILSAADPAQGASLVLDRISNDTTCSGTQGLMANSSATGNGGVYLSFDQNLAKFGVVLKSNAANTTDNIVFFDNDGVMVAKYTMGIAAGQSLYFGISSTSGVIRNVWIGPSNTQGNTVIDDLAFVPYVAPAPAFSYSGTAGAAGWSSNQGATLTTVTDHAVITGTGVGDCKLYRSITLASGTYDLCGVGSGNLTVSIGDTSWAKKIASLQLNQAPGWRTDRQRFVVSGTGSTAYYVIMGASPTPGYLQTISINLVKPTPYDYSQTFKDALIAKKASVGQKRGMQILQQSAALPSAYYAELKNNWKGNLVRYAINPANYSATHGNIPWSQALTACLAIAVQDITNASGTGIQFAIELCGGPYLSSEVYSNEGQAYWTRDDLTPRTCANWKAIVTALQPYASSIWGYDLYNEPVDWEQIPNAPRQWWPLAVNLLHTIRTIDATANIIFEPGPGGSFTGGYLMPLPDTNVIYSFHFYDPTEFTFQGVNSATTGASWPNPSDPLKNYPATLYGGTLASYLSAVDNFQTIWSAPLYIGEFSVTRWSPKPDSKNWLQDAVNLFESAGRKWSWTYFAWGAPGETWHGFCLDLDNVYCTDGQVMSTGPTNPRLDDNHKTDRGQVIYQALQANP